MARPSRKQEIQDKIFAAAFQLVSEGGFQQSPMSKLAQLSKVSIGSIYLYFPSKEALIQALFDHVRMEMEHAIMKGYNRKASIRSRFKTIFLNTCDYYRNHKDHFIFMDQFLLSGYNKDVLEAFSENLSKEFLLLYKDGMKSKDLKPIRFENVLSLSYGPIVSLFKKYHTGYIRMSLDTIVELEECVWQAVRS